MSGFSPHNRIIVPQNWDNRRTRLIRDEKGDLYYPGLFPSASCLSKSRSLSNVNFSSSSSIQMSTHSSSSSINRSHSSSNVSLAWDYLDNIRLTKWPRVNTPVPLDQIHEIEPLYSVDINVRNERNGQTYSRRIFV